MRTYDKLLRYYQYINNINLYNITMHIKNILGKRKSVL